MALATKLVITLAELKQSREYIALNPRQRVFVDAYLSTNDEQAATRAAYGVSGTAYAKMLCHKVLSSPYVMAFLDLAEGRSAHERFLLDLANDCRRAKGVAKIEARKLYAKAMGFIPNGDSSPSQEIDADSRVPADALEVWTDKVSGTVIGYRNVDGLAVKL